MLSFHVAFLVVPAYADNHNFFFFIVKRTRSYNTWIATITFTVPYPAVIFLGIRFSITVSFPNRLPIRSTALPILDQLPVYILSYSIL